MGRAMDVLESNAVTTRDELAWLLIKANAYEQPWRMYWLISRLYTRQRGSVDKLCVGDMSHQGSHFCWDTWTPHTLTDILMNTALLVCHAANYNCEHSRLQSLLTGSGVKRHHPWDVSTCTYCTASLVPTPRAPPGEKRSGEWSQISWAYSPKRWKTNEIARLLIIT